MGGTEQLEERLCIRPTSETLFCDHFAHVLQSYRDLPLLYNQWCSVVRWEKTTRPFLRSREFWWQEGHTIHETPEQAIAETEQQLNCYADFCENYLRIPVIKGRKTDSEKFSGAEATYTIEAMMHDGKALQSGTSHYFGDGFSRAFNVQFAGRDNKLQYPYQTSWGMVAGKPPFRTLLPQVLPLLTGAKAVVAYNDEFEKSFLAAYGVDVTQLHWGEDPMLLFARATNGPRRTLVTAAAFFGYQFAAHAGHLREFPGESLQAVLTTKSLLLSHANQSLDETGSDRVHSRRERTVRDHINAEDVIEGNENAKSQKRPNPFVP